MARDGREELGLAYPFDHLMICVADPRDALRSLRAFGLRAGIVAEQPGTGTHHAVFFFDDAYLEIAWPSSAAPAFPDAPGLHFMERTGASTSPWCPFGLSFRAASGGSRLPLSTWAFAAPFLPTGAAPIPIGSNSDREAEPLLVASLVSGRPDRRVPRPPLHSDLDLTAISRVRLSSPAAKSPSRELAAVAAMGWLVLAPAAQHHVELEFAAGAHGSSHDFSPALPLRFRW
ncbi:MAG: VOC family protein [Myxococcales bacterium]|nr:VOC family protein [Myxococcales bacterium]